MRPTSSCAISTLETKLALGSVSRQNFRIWVDLLADTGVSAHIPAVDRSLVGTTPRATEPAKSLKALRAHPVHREVDSPKSWITSRQSFASRSPRLSRTAEDSCQGFCAITITKSCEICAGQNLAAERHISIRIPGVLAHDCDGSSVGRIARVDMMTMDTASHPFLQARPWLAWPCLVCALMVGGARANEALVLNGRVFSVE